MFHNSKLVLSMDKSRFVCYKATVCFLSTLVEGFRLELYVLQRSDITHLDVFESLHSVRCYQKEVTFL